MRSSGALSAWQWQGNEADDEDAMEKPSISPIGEDDGETRIKNSVRLTREVQAYVAFAAALWNETDRLQKKKRDKTWKPATAIERFIKVGLDGLWVEIGRKPGLHEKVEDVARELIANVAAKKRK